MIVFIFWSWWILGGLQLSYVSQTIAYCLVLNNNSWGSICYFVLFRFGTLIHYSVKWHSMGILTYTSLICWDHYLISSSSDCTIKVWFATEEGTLKVTCILTEENVSYLTTNICAQVHSWFYVSSWYFLLRSWRS